MASGSLPKATILLTTTLLYGMASSIAVVPVFAETVGVGKAQSVRITNAKNPYPQQQQTEIQKKEQLTEQNANDSKRLNAQAPAPTIIPVPDPDEETESLPRVEKAEASPQEFETVQDIFTSSKVALPAGAAKTAPATPRTSLAEPKLVPVRAEKPVTPITVEKVAPPSQPVSAEIPEPEIPSEVPMLPTGVTLATTAFMMDDPVEAPPASARAHEQLTAANFMTDDPLATPKPAENTVAVAELGAPALETSPAEGNAAIEEMPIQVTDIYKPITPLLLTAAETEVPDGPPQEAAVKNDPEILYRSPGIIVHKRTLQMTKLQPEMENSAEQYAQLAPAAGESEEAAPLIPLPDAPPPPAPPTPLVATPPAPTPPSPPPAAAAAPESEPNIQLPEAPPVAAASEPAKQPLDTSSVDSVIGSMLTPASPVETLPATEGSDSAPKAEAVKKPAAPKIDTSSEAISEPARTLSPESKAIAEKIPSEMNKPKDTSEKLIIDRATVVEDKPSAEEPTDTVAKHEALGIKIEVKTPRFNADYELEKAYFALNTGNTAEAIEMYKTVLDNDPNNKSALFGLATCYHRTGLIEKARPLYAHLLTLDPQHRDGLNNFLVLMADEAPQEALKQLEELEKRNPNFSPIPAQMAVIHQKLGNSDQASKKMFRAIALAPENLTYRYNLAVMLDKQKNYEEAAKLYWQIIQASQRGEVIPGKIDKIQQRLTFIRSNRP